MRSTVLKAALAFSSAGVLDIAEEALGIITLVMAGGRIVAGELGGGALEEAERHIRHLHPVAALEQEDPDQAELGDGSSPKDAAGVDELGAEHEAMISSNECDWSARGS